MKLNRISKYVIKMIYNIYFLKNGHFRLHQQAGYLKNSDLNQNILMTSTGYLYFICLLNNII
jgi:hypothetical protein